MLSNEERLTFIQTQILRIRQDLMSGSATIVSHTIDGNTTTYNREQALDELRRLEHEEQVILKQYKPSNAIRSFRVTGNTMR